MQSFGTVNGYHIYRCEAGEDDYLFVGTASVLTPWVDVTALPGRVYQYKIAPYNGAGEHPSPLIRTITRTPAAPEWVTAQALPGRVRISWASVECADGYQVAIRSPGASSLMMLPSGLITDTSFVAEGYMDPGSQYEFAVWSVRNEKDSASTFSNVITALSASAPEITAQPEDYSGSMGDTASFTVTVSGGMAPYTYQWQYRRPGESVWYDSSNAAAKTDTLTVEIISARIGQSYRCVVTDANGETVVSATASIQLG